MNNIRKQRVESLMKREISEIIMRELKDPRVKLTSVSRVSLTNDLKTAHVYISVIGGDKERKGSIGGLISAAGFIRREVGSRIDLRYNPELRFAIDESIEEQTRILRLLKQLEDEKKEKAGGDNDETSD